MKIEFSHEDALVEEARVVWEVPVEKIPDPEPFKEQFGSRRQNKRKPKKIRVTVLFCKDNNVEILVEVCREKAEYSCCWRGHAILGCDCNELDGDEIFQHLGPVVLETENGLFIFSTTFDDQQVRARQYPDIG